MKKSFFASFFSAAILTAGTCSSLFAAAQQQAEIILPKLTLPLMKNAPVIDGKIDPAEWSGADQMQRFCKRSPEAFEAQADFRLGSDGVNLYIAARCETGPQGILRNIQPAENNVPTYNDDAFEFVIVPDEQTIYHVIVNANGAFYSQAKEAKGFVAWRPALKAASTVKDGFWDFEFSIPLKDIGVIDFVKQKKPFGIRICRNWKRLKEYGGWGLQSSFENSSAAFFSAAMLPMVAFEENAPVVQVTSLCDKGDTDHFNIKLTVSNPGAKPVPVQVHVYSKPVNSQPAQLDKVITLAPGASEEFSSKGQVLNEEQIATTIFITSPDKSKVYYQRDYKWQRNISKKIFADVDPNAEKWAADFAYYPTWNKLVFKVDLKDLPDKDKVKQIRVDLADGNGNVIASTELKDGAKNVFESIWSIPDLKKITQTTGKPEYTLTFKADGSKEKTLVRKFVRHVMEWEGNKLGKSDVIVPPFTAIKVNGNTLSTVLREHELNSLGLWKQVTAAGKKILADDGILLVASVNGKDEVVSGKDFRFSSVSDTRASASAVLNSSCLKGTAESSWEYDGLFQWRLKLESGKVDSLKLIVPMPDSAAPLLHVCSDGVRFNYGGAMPKGEGRIYDSSKAPRVAIIGDYVPYIWMGGPLRGVSVFGENDRCWITVKDIPCQEIIRKNGTVYLVLNLIARPAEIKEPREIRIGFMATPVKPMEKDWRVNPEQLTFFGSTYYWGTQKDSAGLYPRGGDMRLWKEFVRVKNGGEVDKNFVKEWVDGYYYDKNWSEKQRQQKYNTFLAHTNAGLHNYRSAAQDAKKGIRRKFFWYTNGRGFVYDTPEGRTFLDEWNTPAFTSRDNITPESATYYGMDPQESFRDYAAWYYRIMFDWGICDYIYWDNIFLQSNSSLVGTDAYRLPDGRIQPASGVFNQRENVKRAAVLQTEMNRPARNWVHMTNTAMAPVSSFAGVNYDWEDETPSPFNSSKEYLLAVSIGRQFGCRVKAIGFIHGKTQAELDAGYRTGTGVSITHEIEWGRGNKFYRDIMAKLNVFGYHDAGTAVFNYWDEDYPVKVDGMPNTSSIVIAAHNEAMFMLTNWGDDSTASVTFDAEKIGLRNNFMAENTENNSAVEVKNGTVSCTLKKGDFILLKLK